MTRWRVVLAFSLAPIVGAVVFYGVSLWAAGASLAELGIGLPWLFVGPLIVGAVTEVLLGIPLLLWLRRRRRLPLLSFAVAGLVLGMAVLLISHGLNRPSGVGLSLCLIPSITASVFFGYASGWSSNRPSLERTGFAGRSTPIR
jgi:hypothetical protein